MIKPQFSPRFLIWLVLFCLLMMGVVMAWQHMEPQAEETAFAVARKSILDRANGYKQFWLVHKQPEQQKMDGALVIFNPYGWVLPQHQGKTDCDYWLTLLYPDRKIIGLALLGSDSIQQGQAQICVYQYEGGHQLTIRLDGRRFRVE